MLSMNKAVLIYDTVKYMTWRQWRYRLYYGLRNLFIKRKVKYKNDIKKVHRLGYLYSSNKANYSSLYEASDILQNIFSTVSGKKVLFQEEIDWDLKNDSYRLVCFRLNSFKWLLCLSDAFVLTGNQEYINKGFSLILDWQKCNGNLISGDKWNPYVIAERLMHWIGFISIYCEDNNLLLEYGNWIYAQASELKKSMEFQLGCNHLLSEARALMYAGAFLKDAYLYNYGQEVLLEETKEQFFADGGHYERSVSYHVESLQQCFEAAVLMDEQEDPKYETLKSLLFQPYLYLNSMIMTDGNIPLVNDAAIDYPFLASDFLNTALYFGWKANNAVSGSYSSRWNLACRNEDNLGTQEFFKETGFFKGNFNFANKAVSLFFDVGNNGPDYNLGHTHADSLNILMTINKQCILADSGVFTYKPGTERNTCRSTAAHNTVEIDGMNSSEIWGAFRVGKRAYTNIEEFREAENTTIITASHDGYEKMLAYSVKHSRTLKIDKDKAIIEIIDTFDTSSNNHTGIIRFHIGCRCKVQKIDDMRIQIDDDCIFEFSAPVELQQCKIAAMFGKLEDTICLTSKFTVEDSCQYKTVIKILN